MMLLEIFWFWIMVIMKMPIFFFLRYLFFFLRYLSGRLRCKAWIESWLHLARSRPYSVAGVRCIFTLLLH